MKKKAMNNKHHRSRTLTMSLFFFLLLQVLPYATAQRSNSSIPPPNPTFKPSMTVTIVVLAVACVIIAFFSFYIRRCARDIHMDGMGSVRLTRTRTRPAPRGLDPTLIETFPTFLYSVVKGLKIGKEVLECAVCLNEFEEDETLRLLPQCNHVFHPECIDAWLTSHTTCPVCRANLEAYSPSEATQVPGLLAEENRATPEVSESQTQVLIQVVDGEQNSDSKPDVINPTVLNSFPIQNRPVRSKSTRKGIAGRFPRSHSTGHSLVRFPRSHSTGHSLVQPGGNYERYTLKLPDDVRKQILNGKLTRTTSCVTFPRQGSVSGWSATRNGSIRSSRGRNNHQLGPFDRAGKSDRWGFSIAPPFFWRNNSSSRSKKGDASVSIKTDGVGQSSTTRPPV